MTAILKDMVSKEIISRSKVPNKGKTSLSSLVRMGSKRQVDVLDLEIVKVNWCRSMGESTINIYVSEV